MTDFTQFKVAPERLFDFPESEKWDYQKFADLYKLYEEGHVYKIDGWFFVDERKVGKDTYPRKPILFCLDEKIRVDAPPHLCTALESIEQNEQAIEDVRAGHFGIKIYPYTRYGGEHFSCEFCNI